ncbi:methylated-DNA--[protein]-cysteine S-methyltransferase [Crassaminicella thermophila]|uniref:Methylated-DNA--protein-cysteine methyltransferase n=1 Tax=Crassaminicella thermophila TaxID=2599308 RepID=A0A5C0SJV6_CRATE|nr:methylated-DNA--[protein]-cysteine S-methyltransferase [Crassaminicella thermophila]QEK13468.1 methylated-DNA--[protein]-cysteine S-methyltransferase [Crassaminicella thermophila]
MKAYSIYYNSPIGIMEIVSTKESILSIEFVHKENFVSEVPYILKKAYIQLEEYFQGKRKKFDLSLYLQGTDFQKKVWSALMEIGYGKVVSYKDIAKAIGNEKAARGVGNANNQNKIPIVIPCHRVIGSNGKLTGYEGGLWRKEWLIEHEKKFMGKTT